MARKILGALKSVLKDARRRGLVAQNVAAETTIERRQRHKKRLEVGVDVPTPAEVRALRWSNVQLSAEPTVTLTQRADKWAKIGSPKSETSRRSIPLGEMASRALKEWCLAQPHGRALVFGTASDRPDLLGNLQRRLLSPLQIAVGIADPVIDANGNPVLEPVMHRGKPAVVDGKPQMRPKMRARYSWHSLRHYAVSAWLASSIDPKTVQHWAGHSTLTLTLDTYGHMIPRPDDHQRIAAAEQGLFG